MYFGGQKADKRDNIAAYFGLQKTDIGDNLARYMSDRRHATQPPIAARGAHSLTHSLTHSPPPWLYRIAHPTSTLEPAIHLVPEGAYGKTLDPS